MSIQKKSLIKTLKTTKKANIAKEDVSTPAVTLQASKDFQGRKIQGAGKFTLQGGRKTLEGGKDVMQGGKNVMQGGKNVMQGGKNVMQGGKNVLQGGKAIVS